MSRVRVSTIIDAPPRRVWAAVREIHSHVDWMEDAVAIRYTSAGHEGVGTTFDCETKVGPFRLTDRMEVTEWSEGRAMGIRHVGLVQGTGRFTVRRARRGRTRFTWDERLLFPWWMGGAPGSMVAAPVLRRIWRRNLSNLKRRIEGPRCPPLSAGRRR
ncbi:MAG TPA: SRPBCC family protein [Acidimicrobiales bacterium]|nr:SRPBCC family protein [Acidimicrobiales bacterium]